jgi:drug/metabolite transporter (DMT)-like permease
MFIRKNSLGAPGERMVLRLTSVLQKTWSLADVAIIAYLGIFQTGLSAGLYSIAIRQVPALEANLILMLEPVLNPLWVFLLRIQVSSMVSPAP